MPLLTAIALATTALAFAPVLAGRKRLFLNPALLVFASVFWGVTVKALYILLFRSQPRSIVHDKIYVGAASADSLQVGAWLALAAIAAYAAGYFLVGKRRLAILETLAPSFPITPPTRLLVAGLVALCVASFLAYLYTSGTELFSAPFSEKRFQMGAIGVATRFQYLPYYFFKVAMFSGPLAYGIAYLLDRSEGRSDRRFFTGAFAAAFLFALFLSHFASLRLAVTLILLQVILLFYAFRSRRQVALMATFVMLTAASFSAITLFSRAPEGPGTQQDEVRATEAPRATAPSRPAPSRTRTTQPPAPVPERPAAPPADVPATGTLGNRLALIAQGPLEGRYLFDFTKLAHIADHFPQQQPHLYGGTVLATLVPMNAVLGTTGTGGLPLDRYLAARVFGETGNSVPAGFAGDLYIDFGWAGVIVGLLLLGGFHRLLFNHLTSGSAPGFLIACMIILVPNTSLILLNSGMLPAASRSILGIGILSLLCIPGAWRSRARRHGEGLDQRAGTGAPPLRPRQQVEKPGGRALREDDIQRGPWRWLVRVWPLFLFLGYLTFTVLVFAFGPIPYVVSNPWATYGFLVAAHLALALGYLAAPFRIPRERPAPGDAWIFSVPNLVVMSSVLNIGLLIPSTLFMTGGDFNLIAALTDPRSAYIRAYQASISTTNPWTYPVMFAAPFMALLVPLTFFYWRELPWKLRGLAAGAIAIVFAAGAMLGRNKGIADLVLLTLVFILVHVFRRAVPWSRRRLLLAIGAAVVIFVMFVAFFSVSTVSRSSRLADGYVGAIDDYLDFDNVFVRPFPEISRPGVGLLYNYLTQGYYGLSLSLQVDFVWTRGLGNSFFLHMFEERFLGSEWARANCYPARVEEEFGYRMLAHWHTIYPWLASDLTFPGTVIFVLVIGALLATTWFETLAGVNPFSVSMFANLCLMLFYFNANNQVLAFPVQFSATVGTLALWLITRRRLARGGSAGASP